MAIRPLKWLMICRTFNLEIDFTNWSEDSAIDIHGVVLSCIVVIFVV